MIGPTKKPKPTEFWQTRYAAQVPYQTIGIPGPLARALRDAARARSPEAGDYVSVEAVARRMAACAVERYLVSIGEPIGVDLISILRAEQRAGEEPATILSREEAIASQEARREAVRALDRDRARLAAKSKLFELCERTRQENPVNVRPSDVEHLLLVAAEAGESTHVAIRDSGLTESHPAVKWYRQASRAAQEPASAAK